MTTGLQALYHLHHLGDVVGRARVVLGPLDAQGLDVREEGLDVAVGVLPQRDPLLAGAADGLVVDVGQVHHLGDPVPVKLERASQHVLEQEGPQVADVGEVVDRGSAGVQASVTRLDG